jgi:hypothetical protein
VAEKAMGILEIEAGECEPPKVKMAETRYLNGTLERAGRLIQRVAVRDVLPPSVQELRFPDSEAA